MKRKIMSLALLSMLWWANAPAQDCNFPSYSSQAGRKLVSFALTDGTNTGTVTVNQSPTYGSSIYFDKTSETVSLFGGTGVSFSSLNWVGEWMHGYLYIDYDGDGEFNSTLNADGTTGGELVSYSYLDGTNSLGNPAADNGGVKATVMPAFTLPATLKSGSYKARFKVDWNNTSPCGASDIGATGGSATDFTINVTSMAERTITVKSADPDKGTVAIKDYEGTSVTTNKPLTLVATPNRKFSFLNWTNEATGDVVSTQAEFVQTGSEDATFLAHFTNLTYPAMKRTFTNNALQDNRYLRRVTTTGTMTPEVFNAASQDELPYTPFEGTAGSYVTEGALVDKTATPIKIEQGTTQFTLTYYGWNEDINGHEPQIDWTQEAIFADWNENGSFTDEGETSAKGSTTMPNTAILSDDGLSRTVTVPANLPTGTYRLRTVFFEPASQGEDWNNTLFTTLGAQMRNGIAYDFAVQVVAATPMEVKEVTAQTLSGNAGTGQKNIKLATVNIATEGMGSPLSVEELKVRYTGTASSDITNLRWYYSTNESVAGQPVATLATAAEDMTFTANRVLTAGANYLVLLADVAATAPEGNKINLRVTTAKVAGKTFEATSSTGQGFIVKHLTDYTLGNAIWFDTPNSSTQGVAIWKQNDFSSTDTNPDQTWERKSLPIGNGSIGANILGSVSRERIVMNEKTLWKGGPGTGAETYWDMNNTVSESTLAQIREYLKNGQNAMANSLVSSNYRGKINYDRHRFGTFTTLGEAYVSTGINEGAVTDYKRILNVDSSMVVVQFAADGVNYTRKYFASYPDSVMVWQFASEGGKQNLTWSYECPQQVTSVTREADGLLFKGTLDNNGMQWALRVEPRSTDGTISVDAAARTITISNATNAEFLVTADTDYKMNFDPNFSDAKTYVGVDPVANVNDIIAAAKDKNYDELLARHRADYSALYSRVELAINPGSVYSNLPTPKRLAAYRTGTLDHELEQTYFQFGRYLLISSSRAGNMPANLQGMWHNNTDGPWRVDYHNNINLQMNYWPATSTNLLECFQPFTDYVRSLVKPGQRTAQAYYGARGWTAEVSTNIFGFTAPLNSTDMSWNYNPTAGPWLATQVYEYFDYTRDLTWLENVGYDIIKQSAQFAEDLLFDVNGTLTSAPSYSPEHGTADLGATYANAVTREILTDAIRSAQALGKDADLVEQWQDKLNRMYPYQIGRYGQLQEWYNDIDKYGDQHRHTNHLFGLHPGTTISPSATPALAEACKETLRQRGDEATGWSMGWKLNHWARLHDGDHAYILFQNLLKQGTADNLWDLHPPFQIDGNFGGTAGIAELFLQSQNDTIYLLPALPKAWTNGHIKGLLTRGNFTVDVYHKDGKLDHAVVVSNKGSMLNMVYNGHKLNMPTTEGGTYRIFFDETTGQLKAEDTDAITSTTTGATEQNITVMPSPNNGQFVARVKGQGRGPVTLTVFSVTGQKMAQKNINKSADAVDVPFAVNAPAGCYLLSAAGKGQAVKFVIR